MKTDFNAVALECEHVGLTYSNASSPALQDIALQVSHGQTLAVLGPSGCGKSSLLRIIAGLERDHVGTVSMNGVNVTRKPPERRGVGLVFQDYALWPHRNVAGNIAYGLEESRVTKTEIRQRIQVALNRVNLSGYGLRKIHELSGGERQRVALARALAPEPHIMLMDEPLSNLDEGLRNDLRLELRALFDALELTVVFVTHDQREAFALAHCVAIMRAGQIVQVGSPENVFHAPIDAWTARFLGHVNLLEHKQALRLGFKCATTENILIPEHAMSVTDVNNSNNAVPNDVIGHNLFEATVIACVFEGRSSHIRISCQNTLLELHETQTRIVGSRVQLCFNPQFIRAIPA